MHIRCAYTYIYIYTYVCVRIRYLGYDRVRYLARMLKTWRRSTSVHILAVGALAFAGRGLHSSKRYCPIFLNMAIVPYAVDRFPK